MLTKNAPTAERTWYVCASHRTALASHAPFGLRHARQAGSRNAACGDEVFGWTMFWAERFELGMEQVCPRCCEAVITDLRRTANVERQFAPVKR